MEADAHAPPDDAQLTRWSLIARAQETDAAVRGRAMEDLMQTYLPVLHWYLRRHAGLDDHQREDLVQGFIAEKVLERNILARADRERGRFRTFLLNAFQNYVRDALRRAQAARRMPAAGPPLPLEEADGTAASDDAVTRDLDRAWMHQVVATALEAMEAACRRNGRRDVWGVFQSRLVGPLLEGQAPEPYEMLVKRLELESPSRASNLLVTAKRMFNRHLEQVVADTVCNPSQAAEELEYLKQCL